MLVNQRSLSISVSLPGDEGKLKLSLPVNGGVDLPFNLLGFSGCQHHSFSDQDLKHLLTCPLSLFC